MRIYKVWPQSNWKFGYDIAFRKKIGEHFGVDVVSLVKEPMASVIKDMKIHIDVKPLSDRFPNDIDEPEFARLSWSSRHFVLSPAGYDCFKPFIDANCEELPFIMPEAFKQYRVFNCLNVINAIDFEASRVRYFRDGKLSYVYEYVMYKDRIAGQSMFTDKMYNELFLGEEFYQSAKKYGIQAAEFSCEWDSEWPERQKPISSHRLKQIEQGEF